MAAVFTVALLAGARLGIPEAAGVGLVGMAAGALVQTAGDLLPVPPADLGRLLALRRRVHAAGKPQ